ncbi:hypothetical protein [Kitasatospora sp. NPDC086791]|uniref:hypothetical protein n=1 Tax=Kitasatospora sp. NPDC086791 TaxID=3155178 RepID=UPI00342E8FDF
MIRKRTAVRLGAVGRKVAAVALAGVALVGVAGAGTANATTDAGTGLGTCGPGQGGGLNSPWYGWTLTPCVNIDSSGYLYSTVTASGGQTDVRLYTGVYDNCNGVTYGINGDSTQNHAWPTYGYTESYHVNPPYCAKGYWGIARLTNNGQGSPWAWSQGLYIS